MSYVNKHKIGGVKPLSLRYISSCLWMLILQTAKSSELPGIKLYSYKEPDSVQETIAPDSFATKSKFKNDFLSKQDSDYLIQVGTTEVWFVCEAAFPVTWSFPFSHQLPNEAWNYINSDESRGSSFESNMSIPASTRWLNKISIRFPNLDFFSVNLTCSTVGNNTSLKSSSIHVFLQDKTVLENQGKVVSSEFAKYPHSNNLIIPCRASSMDVPNVLEMPKLNSNKINTSLPSIDWKPVNLVANKFVKYNAKIGYIFKNDSSLAKHPNAYFKCSTRFKEGNQYSVYFNMTSPKSKNAALSIKNVSVVEPQACSIEHPRNGPSQGKCCFASTGKLIRIWSTRCFSPASCDLLRDNIMGNTKGSLISGNETGIANRSTCVGKDLKGLMSYVHATNGQSDAVGFYLHIIKLRDYASSSLTKFEPLTSNITVEEKMAIFVGKVAGSIKSNYGREVRFPGTTRTPPENHLHIEQYYHEKGSYYDQESLVFFCVGVPHFYAHGAHMRITWKNGSLTTLPEPAANSPFRIYAKTVYFNFEEGMFDGLAHLSKTMFWDPIKMDQKMSKVECWQPLLESTEWNSIGKSIVVLPTHEPRFIEKMEETVTFKLGDLKQKVDCTVVEAQPQAHTEILWNGKKPKREQKWVAEPGQDCNVSYYVYDRIDSQTDHKVERKVIQTITLEKITKDCQRTLKCIASNTKKQVERIIHVVVSDN